MDGVELQFEAGKVVSASASKNEAFLQQVLDTDPGARYLGEFAIGTNDGINQFTKSILYDEKIGGTIHLAVGAGYPETGSHNESAANPAASTNPPSTGTWSATCARVARFGWTESCFMTAAASSCWIDRS